MKKLIGLAVLAGLGYVAYTEYNRRKEAGDEFILKLDGKIHSVVDEVSNKVDGALSKIEKKLDKAQDKLEEVCSTK